MGEKLRGFKGNGFILKFGLCLTVLPLMHFIFIMLCMVEYIVETLPKVKLDNVCSEIQVHHTCIYCERVCSIYVGSTHISCISCSLCE